MKLLLDEIYPPRLADELRKRGHDVVAVTERPHLRAAEDDALLMAATAEDRVLVSENVADFPEVAATLAADEQTQCGVILVPSHTFPRTERGLGLLVRSLDAYLAERTAERTVSGGIHWLHVGQLPATSLSSRIS